MIILKIYFKLEGLGNMTCYCIKLFSLIIHIQSHFNVFYKNKTVLIMFLDGNMCNKLN